MKAIANPLNELLVSAATVREIAIKLSIGKLSLSMPYREWMEQALLGLQASILPITVEYAGKQAELPKLHRDPFDRLLIAQALVEDVSVISADSSFEQYGVTRIW
ncbi:MAG TPA: type II toxin-antitoxin system VapC family toxin [Thermoanaerobaculia bacterium]|jgi:PIN domain nuclease of toxin-antitoxin system|nr:type II toxin-antitoxin system VapC family toxin [Thermoanaerobaculia bacterium]